MIHIRIYTHANDAALKGLSGTQYKTLIYLVNRADELGRCFPSQNTIADAIGIDERRTITAAISELIEGAFIAVLRQSGRDNVTGVYFPNVYMINPNFICLGDAHHSDAMTVWRTLCNTEHMVFPVTHKPSSEPTPITNTSNQHQISSSSSSVPEKRENILRAKSGNVLSINNKDKDEKQKGEKKKPQETYSPDDNEREGAIIQRRAAGATEPPSSAAPPSAGGKKYKQPDVIGEPLDTISEGLAVRIQDVKIPLALARGFIVEYGADNCQTALALVQGNLDAWKNPAAGFRYFIQNPIAKTTVDARKFKTAKQGWGEETDQEYGSGKFANIIEK